MVPLSQLRLLLLVAGCTATVKDAEWDCQFRQLATDYARDVVLAPAAGWSPARARAALATIGHGLNIAECNLTHLTASHRTSQQPHKPAAAATTSSLQQQPPAPPMRCPVRSI